ncbi:MAG: PqqD family protein [Ruminococcaceae bacterium]|nr:PqqD family protein [Oscillospiraceae bacterium]
MFCINKAYIMRNIDGQIFLINMKEGEAHLLNSVATLILEHINECGELNGGLRRIKEYFADIDSERIETDYWNLVKEFIQKKIIVNNDHDGQLN